MKPSLAHLALCSLLVSVGCAEGTLPEDDVAAVLDTVIVDETEPDVVTVDTPDVVTMDTPDVVSVDTPDVVSMDTPDVVSVDSPDVVSFDTVTPMDIVSVGPVRCTPSTASAVCGGRACVDGFCCDNACSGACRGCAVPGMEGRCTVYPPATDPESECPDQAPATCGTTGTCNGAGVCARHPMGTPCDDGMACTSADVCDGAGVCRGAAPAMCAPGAGNQCCLGSCDPMMGCRTTPGLCADQCGGNLLRTARVCQGCGPAAAAGTCGGGGEFACDATMHTLCRAVPCGGQTFYCTNDGGTWQWRTGTRCDDGDACTHTDACAAGACGGTRVTCASDACAARACTGAATCMVTPRTGALCDDGNPMTNSDVCSSAGVCVGTVVCALPTDACADGAQSRDRCAGARVIGRRSAASTAGFSVTGSTCSASNRFDDCNWDAGNDHAYRIWARAGETVTVNLTRGTACVGGNWDATLKLYQGSDCGTVTCSGDRWCRDFVGTGAQTYVAPRDGWIVVVVDGSTAFSDEGEYTLRARLTGCRGAGCECP